MIAWLGLLIALGSSLVACLSNLKRHPGKETSAKVYVTRRNRLKRHPRRETWAGAIISRRNRLVVVSACLAILGFLVAALGVRQASVEAGAEKAKLLARNRTLQSLLLHEKHVKPVIRLILGTKDPQLGAGYSDEFSVWQASSASTDLPRSVGFLPKRFRSQLFRCSVPDDLLRYQGDVDIRTGRPGWRFNFRVRDDGSIRSGLGPFEFAEIRVGLVDGSAGEILVTIGDEVDALGLYHSVVRAHEEEITPLRIRSFGAREGLSERVFRRLRGRLTFFLDEKQQISVTALLVGSTVEFTSDGVEYGYSFAEAPHLDVSMPGGMH